MSAPSDFQVLIVEDVAAMQQLLSVLVDGIAGLKVSGLAKNTWEVRLELTRRRPDLVILDEVLPGESSLDLLQDLIREKIPVLLITGMADPSHPLPPGVQARLSKPDWDSLVEDREQWAGIIREVLKPRPAR